VLRKVVILLLTIQGIALLPADSRHVAPDAYVSAADKFIQVGRYKDAVTQYSKAIRCDRNNPRCYQSRAKAELQLNKYKQAIGDLSHAISLNPNDADIYELRAHSYEAICYYKSVKRYLDSLMAVRPNVGAQLLWRAQIEKRLNDMHSVLADCNKAITLNLSRQQLSELYKLRADAYKKLGKKGEWQEELAKYESLCP